MARFVSAAGLGGLGEYPGYYCYDANRPSWLPYWIDDLTESACKWNPKTIAGNLYACTIGSTLGDPSCATPPPGWSPDPTVSGPGVETPEGQASAAQAQCGFLQTWNPISAQCEFNFASPSFLIPAGIGLAVLLLLKK